MSLFQGCFAEKARKSSLFILFFGMAGCFIQAWAPQAARIIDTGPITDEIYMLWFRDGEYAYYSATNWSEPLDVGTAGQSGTYSISSTDDADFSGGRNPAQVGRKSKGSSFAAMGSASYNQDHWIFLKLPAKLKRGKSYSISMGGLGSAINFTYDEFSQFNEAIHVSHYGYPPQSTMKHAYLSMYMGDMGGLTLESHQGAAFHVVREDTKEIIFSGTIAKKKDLETDSADYYSECAMAQSMWFRNPYASYTMADVWECDFTGVTPVAGYNGKYTVVVEGMGCSFPFRLDTDVYHDAWKDCMHGIYHQRCGIPKESQYTEWTQNACHPVGIVYKQTSAPGQNGSEGNVPPVTGKTFNTIFGGYHDAADYDKWISHLDVPRNLLLAYELRPEIFIDGELSIPENDNGVPDILDEAAWCIAFFMRMQEDHGGVMGTQWEPSVGGNNWYVGPAEIEISYYYSAMANALAYCLDIAGVNAVTGPYYNDVDLSAANLKASAKNAYDWAVSQGPGTSPGLRYYAHAWMFKVTEDAQYQTLYKTGNPVSTATTHLFPEPCGSETGPDMQWAVWAYVMTDNAAVDAAYQNTQKQACLEWTDYDRIRMTENRGFRLGHHRRMPPLVGNQTCPEVFAQAHAFFALDAGKKYLDAIYPTIDYHLGGNELNQCNMSKCGYRNIGDHVMHTYNWILNDPKGVPKGVIHYGSHSTAFAGVASVNQVNSIYAVRSCYPVYTGWPQFELDFNNRFCAITNEFTTPQTNGLAAFAYAILKDGGPGSVNVMKSPGTVAAAAESRPVIKSILRTGKTISIDFNEKARRTVTLLDINGKNLCRHSGAQNPVSLPLNGIAQGYYFIKVTGDGSRTVVPVSIIH